MKMNLDTTMKVLQKPLSKRIVAVVVALAVFHVSLAIAEPSRGVDGFNDTAVEAQPAHPNRIKVLTEFTGYTTDPNETDLDNCTPANPKVDICDPRVAPTVGATNAFPLGTVFEVEVSGSLGGYSKTRVNVDRMNKRYQYNEKKGAIYVDLLFPDKASAKQFGRRMGYIIILN